MVPSPDISWTAGFRQDFAKKKTKHPEQGKIVRSAYRPFAKQFLWFDKQTNERTYLQPQLFPYPEAKNLQISIVLGSRQFSCLMTDVVPDIQLSFNAQCFPLYWYEKLDDDSPEKYGLDFYEIRDRADSHWYVRHDAITDTALNVFRAAYPALSITKEDIFYYVYGILHSSEYRRRFANNLTKELPRIPLARNFKAFEQAGRKLAKLHLNYEKVKPWDVTEIGDPTNPGRTVRMTYPRKVKDPDTGKKVADLTVLQVAENLTIENIPLRAYEYVVNGKTAIGWLIDRYQVTTDKKSGITNDPNDYSDDPRYIVDLVEKVIRVSVETVDIINGLPKLDEIGKPANWPQEWN